MRFIDNSKISIDKKWEMASQKALAKARTIKDPKERAKFINKCSKIWKRLKPELEKISYGKCWYCESREIRSDRAVDHYRPKNSVGNSKHNGYWWRAFQADNFRLSCTYCNSFRQDRESGETRGKGDLFPLWDEKKRVCQENSDANCKHEDPLLLDPCKRSDVALLWFGGDGRAVSKYSANESLHAYRRVETSINCYHLNEKEIKEARQALLYNINKLIEEGDYYFQDYLNGEPNAERGISETMLRLEKFQQPEAEFSAFAKSTILGLKKKGREWLDPIW